MTPEQEYKQLIQLVQSEDYKDFEKASERALQLRHSVSKDLIMEFFLERSFAVVRWEEYEKWNNNE